MGSVSSPSDNTGATLLSDLAGMISTLLFSARDGKEKPKRVPVHNRRVKKCADKFLCFIMGCILVFVEIRPEQANKLQ